MDKTKLLLYTVPGTVLLLYFLGIEIIIYTICAFFFFISGFYFFLMHNGKRKRKALYIELNEMVKNFKFSQGNEEFLKNESRFKDFSMYDEKHSMTGSDIIDPILEQILQYIIRDSIDSWYTKLSPNSLFQESLKRTARRTIAAFNHCLKKVDWVPLLTRDFVDDFASHLRLYRKAKEKIQIQKERNLKTDDLASVFFDLELEMEKSYCRDLISTSQPYESAYLHDLVDILLYLLMPSEDFRSRPLRFLVREVFVSKIFVPLLDKLSDPFYMNYLIVWLLSELPINTDDFVTCLETCQSVQELESILESIHEEINLIKAKDTKGDSESFKQQLTSLEFTESLIKRQMLTLTNKPEVVITNDLQLQIDKEVFSDETMIHLPITVVLTHSVAISFFVEFLTHVGGLPFIDFYLSIEGFKSSIDHQLRGLANGKVDDSEVHETAKEVALFMYHQYLSQEAITRIPLEDSIINKFLARLRNDEPSDSWFEQIQEKVIQILSCDERFYPNFKKNPLYIRMLEDLGIMGSVSEDLENLSCGDSEANSETESCRTKSPGFLIPSNSIEDSGSHIIDSTVFWSQTPLSNSTTDFLENKFITKVLVDTLGVGQQGKQMFALYNVRVFKSDIRSGGKNSSSWNVIRRYSDFHTLNETIILKYPNLKNISFPGKKTFNNLEQEFLEKRCKALNEYMTCLLQPNLLNSIAGLEAEIYDFLSQKCYKGNKGERLTKKMTSMFNPILSGVKAFGIAVTSVPDQVFDGMSKVGNELNRAANQVLKTSNSLGGQSNLRSTINSLEFKRVASQLNETDSNESIPLRVILLFVDEVFGLRGRNQWFRRRLVALLRQFVNAAFGFSINKRIVDAVLWLTSDEQVSQYLIAFKDSMWNELGDIIPSQKNLSSDALRTRFLARCLMLSALPDQLRLFIGSSTTINGINNISEALQNSQFNRRFWYVILERMLVNIFPNNRFEKILPMLHKKSPRQLH